MYTKRGGLNHLTFNINDIEKGSLEVKKNYWGTKFGLLPSASLGRIDRKNYGLCTLLFVLVIIFLGLLSLGLDKLPDSIFKYSLFIPIIFLEILLIISIPLWVRMHIRRFHDLGNDGWKIVFLFVPYLGAIFGLWLLLAKGQDRTNRFGEPVPNNAKFFDVVLGRKEFSPSIKEQTSGEPPHGADEGKISMKTDNVENLEKLFCFKCGSQIDLDSKYCSNCGSGLVIPPKTE